MSYELQIMHNAQDSYLDPYQNLCKMHKFGNAGQHAQRSVDSVSRCCMFLLVEGIGSSTIGGAVGFPEKEVLYGTRSRDDGIRR